MTTFKSAEGYVSRDVGDETIIVPVRAGVADLDAIFTLNPVGSTIWGALQAGATLDDVTRVIARDYEVGESEAAADAAQFIDLLVAQGLVILRTEARL